MFRAFVITLVIVSKLPASDWPQLLGPNRDGQSSETQLNWNWSTKPPTKAWALDVGTGWAGFVVAEDKGYLFHRVKDREIVTCLNSTTGKELWTFGYPAKYLDDFQFDDGPRATPTVTNGTIFTLGANGDLHAVDAKRGEKIWHRKLLTEYAAGKGYFGVACSPLVAEKKVIINVGGKGAGVVAFDSTTGEEIWKVSSHEASYSSPVVAEFKGTKLVICFTRLGLLGVELTSGKQLFELKWRSRIDASVNAATPLILDGHIFLTSSYGTGAILLKCDGKTIEEVWSNDKTMSCQYSTPIRSGGNLFGTDGRADFNTGTMKCIDWATGKVHWQENRFGCAGMIAVDGKLIAICESGEVVALAADSQKYTELGRLRILDGKVRAVPSFASGLLFARDEKKLVAIRLK
jgi:outer membrane protein assembly factor BamB